MNRVLISLVGGGEPSVSAVGLAKGEPRGMQVTIARTCGVGARISANIKGISTRARSWLHWKCCGLIAFLGAAISLGGAATSPTSALPDLSSVAPDLQVPEARRVAPAAGVRSVQTTAGWEGTAVHHMIYLPTDWAPGRKFPVLVEYAGNGGYRNAYGDVSEGTVEGCRLGYGISGGRGFIWVCLPFVEKADGAWRNAAKWWGDVEETKRYCRATVRDVCARYGGDERAVVLSGFSRGSIAANFIGLHDDEIAGLWRAFFCHSHYDGVSEHWPYAGADRASALIRLRRLAGRPQFISHEGSTTATEKWLRSTGLAGNWTFAAVPFRNHSPDWLLRDLPVRRQARAWLAAVLAPP